MATGGLDANGIWLYGEDDSEPTASALLNKLGNSISDKFDGGLPVANGGTAATTADTAKTNLGIPMRQQTGIGVGVSNAQATITYASGRFTVAPILNITPSGGPSIVTPYVSANTATSFTFALYTTSGVAVAQGMHWRASQHNSSGAGG